MNTAAWPVAVGGADGGCVAVGADETLLAAFTAAHWRVANGCRNGCCQACRATLRRGQVLAAGRVVTGQASILPCRAQPLSPLELDWPSAYAPGSPGAARNLYCRFLDQRTLTDNHFEIALELPPGRLPRFTPGQWLEGPDGQQLTVLAVADRRLRLFGDTPVAAERGHLRLHGPRGTVAAPQAAGRSPSRHQG